VSRAAVQSANPSIFVAIRTPADGQTFKSDGTIHLSATAMEPRGIIRQVAYYDGANRIASSTRPDFQAVWQNPLPGDHYLVAVATDVRGQTATSSQVRIIVLPANDDFSAATKLNGTHLSVVGSTFGATLEPGETDWIGGGPSVWYSWTAPADGRVALAMPNWPWGVYFGALTGNSVTNLSLLGQDLPLTVRRRRIFILRFMRGLAITLWWPSPGLTRRSHSTWISCQNQPTTISSIGSSFPVEVEVPPWIPSPRLFNRVNRLIWRPMWLGGLPVGRRFGGRGRPRLGGGSRFNRRVIFFICSEYTKP
jgi:hypothetical protein